MIKRLCFYAFRPRLCLSYIGRRLERRKLRALNKVVSPTNYPSLQFVSPTRSIRSVMLEGPDREPETREWIESIPRDQKSTLWDVGANVGSFSVYAAVLGIRVVAIEPMPHNLMLLTRNIMLNNVQSLVVVVPFAVSRRSEIARFRMSSLDFGAARHGFGGDDSSAVRTEFQASFQSVGMSIDAAVSTFGLFPPTHLKVDVDGIDDEVIYGSSRILSDVRSVCCEMKFEDRRTERLIQFLDDVGLKLAHRTRRNGFFDRS